MAATAGAVAPPLVPTSSSVCPRRVNSLSVRNLSRLRSGCLAIERQGFIPSGTSPQSPARRYIRGEGAERHVRGNRRRAQTLVHLRDLRALDRRERQLPQGRQDVLADRRADRLEGLRLTPHRGVFREIPPGELGYRRPAGGLLRLERRLIARLDPGDDHGRPLARLLGMDYPVPADRHAPGSLGTSCLGDVDLRLPWDRP